MSNGFCLLAFVFYGDGLGSGVLVLWDLLKHGVFLSFVSTYVLIKEFILHPHCVLRMYSDYSGE